MRFFDVETTGTDPQHDRVTQVAVVDERGGVWQTLVNPGRPIPPHVQELTGITDAAVADAQPFAAVAAELSARLGGHVLVGFGSWQLDIPVLAEEFERAGVGYAFGEVIDVGVLFKLARPRSLAAAVSTYLADDAARVFAGECHDAAADAEATRRVFEVMRHAEPLVAGKSPAELALLSCHGRRPADPFGKLVVVDGVVCFNTHRNRGVPVADDVGYAEWMLRSDFPTSTKRVLRAELARLEAEAEPAGLFDALDDDTPY